MRPCPSPQSCQIIFVDRVIGLCICCAVSLLAPLPTQAQSKTDIDAAMSTRRFRRADAALNRAYTQDMAGRNNYISPGAGPKKALKAAQLAWLQFRDAEAAFVASGYEHTHTHTGGHWVEVYAAVLTALTDERTRYLTGGAYYYSGDDPDQELNDAYKALLSVLYDRQKKLLIKAELAWIQFRDAEAGRIGGSKPVYSEWAFDQLTADRTRALKASYRRYKQLNSPD